MQMQRECETNRAVAEAAMQAAVSEVLAVTEQLDKETAARESLEGVVRDLREARRQCQHEHEWQVAALERRYQDEKTHVRAALYFSLALLCVYTCAAARVGVFSSGMQRLESVCSLCATYGNAHPPPNFDSFFYS
jgi:hydroxypyruvate isomerase